MMVHMQVTERMSKYMAGEASAYGVKQTVKDLFKQDILFEHSNAELTIVNSADSMELMKPVLTSLFHTLIFFMMVLTFILNKSLVQSVSLFQVLMALGCR